MSYQTILYETRGSVALITLNRPEKLNAWTPQMAAEQADAIERANTDHEIGAIVFTGAGRGFCAGADMEATFKTRLDGNDPGANTAGGQGGMPAGLDWVALARRSKPLLAAVNGAAVGIGMTMILPFDVILASEKAKFGMFFIKMGLVPELASTHYLVQRMGFGRASEMCLSGRLYGGEEARVGGLVDRLVPHAEPARRFARARGRDRRQSGQPAEDDQILALDQWLRRRSHSRSATRDGRSSQVLEVARARRSRHCVPREASAEVPLSPRRALRA